MEPRKKMIGEEKEQKKLVSDDTVENEPDRPVPHGYECSITDEIMQDPVILADGHSYERAAIKEWLEQGNLTSPLTGKKLKHTKLVSNHALKKAIQEFLQQRHTNENEKKAGQLDPMQSAIKKTITTAQKKHHPRSQVADTLLKLMTVEATLNQQYEVIAANKIKRFYLTHRQKGLKAFVKTSRLYKQQEALSHQLKQSIEKGSKQKKEFKASFQAQEKTREQEREAVKAKHEANIKKAAALGAWGQIQEMAKKAVDEEKIMQLKHDQAKQALLETQEEEDKKQTDEQSKLRQELKQIAQAKLDKYNGVIQRVNPILAMDKAIRTSEQQQAVLMEEEAKLAGALKEKMESQRKPASLIRVGIFKPETKQSERKLDSKGIDQVLTHVAYGQQDEAEMLLKKEPYLALAYGAVTDPGGRTFKKMTAFQYAVWALDWHMWEMMLRCFKEEHLSVAAEQYKELDEKGTEHGKQFSLGPLIEALKAYSEKYDGWTDEQRKHHWQKVVAGEQAKLTMHVVNEYCRPDRSFEERKDMFQEKTLPRGKGDEDRWMHYDNSKEGGGYKYTLGGLGGDWAWCRGSYLNVREKKFFYNSIQTDIDNKALSLLNTIRVQQKSELAQKLASKNSSTLRLSK